MLNRGGEYPWERFPEGFAGVRGNNVPGGPAQPMELNQVPHIINTHVDTVTGHNKCQSKNAKRLCIFDMAHKLNHADKYDIGGTSTDTESDTYFYYTTSVCPGNNHLLNLFVCHRKPGLLSIGISNCHEFAQNTTKRRNEISFPDSLVWYAFRSAHINEIHYIKTFQFTSNDLKTLENNILFIPIAINMNPLHALNEHIIKRIKLNHDTGNRLLKQAKTDFILESASHKQFPTHKIALIAHSPTLRAMIQNTTSNTIFLDISDSDMELLLQFIYTGTIKDILKQDCLQMLKLADRFQLKSLLQLTQYALSAQINIENAVEIVVISEKYKLEELQQVSLGFMRNNAEVLETEAWKKLDNVQIVKKLFEYTVKHKYASNEINEM